MDHEFQQIVCFRIYFEGFCLSEKLIYLHVSCIDTNCINKIECVTHRNFAPPARFEFHQLASVHVHSTRTRLALFFQLTYTYKYIRSPKTYVQIILMSMSLTEPSDFTEILFILSFFLFDCNESNYLKKKKPKVITSPSIRNLDFLSANKPWKSQNSIIEFFAIPIQV